MSRKANTNCKKVGVWGGGGRSQTLNLLLSGPGFGLRKTGREGVGRIPTPLCNWESI